MSEAISTFAEACRQSFEACGLRPGDNVYVHCSLVQAGLHTEIDDGQLLCASFLQALRDTLQDGIIAVSTATWETSSCLQDYHLHHTPCSADIGIFAEFLRQHASTERSIHPVCSMAMNSPAMGFSRFGLDRHRYAYGLNSPWAVMVEEDFKVVFFGLPSIKQLTLVHHIEQCSGVPYVYNKVFPCRVYGKRGVETGDFSFSVPYLEHDIRLSDLACLKVAGAHWSEHVGAFGKVQVAAMREVFNSGLDLLRDDPYAFLRHPPRYREGKIPVDRFIKEVEA